MFPFPSLTISKKADQANRGPNYFFGGLLLIISGLLEFFLGNTFPSVVFFGYGAHFLT
jgi:succinate-acetate transporter protein